ncbi:MAG: SpaA isopeptide-forming pilin-related protein, partial [Eubacteriales bacterium]|nr:SpaA isopeptide-forming pilin-related protein [Eubacteriales bacterium]
NAGYRLIEPFTVEIKEHGKIYQYSLTNELKSQKLRIEKLDEAGNVVALAGFEFKIKQADGSYLSQTGADGTKTDTYTTDESGSITLPQVLAAGNYAVVEINTPAGSGYVLNETELPFEIKDDQDVTLTVSFKNESQKGVLKLNKTGEQLVGSTTEAVTVGGQTYTVYKPLYEARALAGATFELRAEDGTVVETLTTDGVNELQFAPVPLGKYFLVETATAPGFVLDSTPIEVVFTPQEQTIRFDIQSKTIENDRQKINVGFNKTFEESKWFKREGVTATFGLFAKSDIVGADGTVAIAKDSLLGVTLVTKEEGKGSFTDITVTNQLYIKELATHEAYQLNDANIDVTTDYMPNTDMQRTVEKSVEDPIVNDLKKIKMELLKVAQHDNKTPVAGAKFKLVAVVDDKTTKEIGVYTTDENGRILVDGLEVGNYRFEEIEVPQDYIKPEEPVTDVAIDGGQAHDSTQSITVENEKKPQIKTTAMVNGAKEVEAAGTVTLTDTVTYTDLIPGKEYEAVLVWMDKSTGKPFMVDGKELTVSKKFTPEQSNGEISLSIEVDAKHFIKTVDLVAFEDLLKEGIEVAAHKDLNDQGQTVKIKQLPSKPPKKEAPQTGDGQRDHIGRMAAAAGICIGIGILVLLRRRRAV